MLYECSCSYTAGTATAFYKHLARARGDGETHQLVQTSAADRHGYHTRSTAAAVASRQPLLPDPEPSVSPRASPISSVSGRRDAAVPAAAAGATAGGGGYSRPAAASAGGGPGMQGGGDGEMQRADSSGSGGAAAALNSASHLLEPHWGGRRHQTAPEPPAALPRHESEEPFQDMGSWVNSYLHDSGEPRAAAAAAGGTLLPPRGQAAAGGTTGGTLLPPRGLAAAGGTTGWTERSASGGAAGRTASGSLLGAAPVAVAGGRADSYDAARSAGSGGAPQAAARAASDDVEEIVDRRRVAVLSVRDLAVDVTAITAVPVSSPATTCAASGLLAGGGADGGDAATVAGTFAFAVVRHAGSALMSAMASPLHRWSVAFGKSDDEAPAAVENGGATGGTTAEQDLWPRRRAGAGAARSHDGGVGGSASPQAHVVVLEDVLTWREPWTSGKVLGIGLYLLLCIQQFSFGSRLLQPSTVLIAAAFVYLLYNTSRNAIRACRRRNHTDGTAPPESPIGRLKQQERYVQERVCVLLQASLSVAVPYVAAAVALCWRVLSGRKPITSVVVAVALWAAMMLSELHVFSQMTFAMLAYTSAFVVPAAYMRCQPSIDRLVEEVLRFAARLLLSGNRLSLLLAVGGAAAVLNWAPLPIVMRTTCAGACGFSILFWRVVGAARASAA